MQHTLEERELLNNYRIQKSKCDKFLHQKECHMGFTFLNRSVAKRLTSGLYQVEGCGICEKFGDKAGGNVWWFSPFSRTAHAVCVEKIKPIEARVVALIDQAAKEKEDRAYAHMAAIGAVKKELGHVTIETYLDTHGAAKLKSIFDRAGEGAAFSYFFRVSKL